jgi:hypothetical protein
MPKTFVALIEAADPHDIMECPHSQVKASLLPHGIVRLVSESYEALIEVLVFFVGMSPAEADILIEEMV